MSRFFGGIRQLAMVVPDADAAMRTWAETLGVGPFICVRELTMENFRYRGEPSPSPVVTLCFAQSGELQIEIIQQHNKVPSAYTEFLARGQQGCQHVAAWYESREHYDQDYALALERGMQLVHEGDGEQDGTRARFSYFETGLPGGLMLELAEAMLPGVRELPAMVRSLATGWDGTDSVR